jgi:hypothetical protein
MSARQRRICTRGERRKKKNEGALLTGMSQAVWCAVLRIIPSLLYVDLLASQNKQCFRVRFAPRKKDDDATTGFFFFVNSFE